jgi:hypothetical protein
MLLEQTSKEFRMRFLLRLTRELIENTKTYQELKIKREIEFIEKKKEERPVIAREIQKQEEIKRTVSEKMREEHKRISEMEHKGLPIGLQALSTPIQKPVRQIIVRKAPQIPQIPEPALPPTVSYLRPIPTSEEIDLGRINILVRDPLVKIIESDGPEENIFVVGMMGRKPTAIKLSKEELQAVLERFSTASKIPLHEGLFKAAVGRLVISAVVSEIAGIKFVIRKISQGF